jgi:UDP-N-acetyl-D-mannosaminuronic acid transferase (WecB/TagA/CpsF family)
LAFALGVSAAFSQAVIATIVGSVTDASGAVMRMPRSLQGTGVQRTYATGLNWDRVVSPTLITQVRLGIAHYNYVAKRTGYGKATSTGIGTAARGPGLPPHRR